MLPEKRLADLDKILDTEYRKRGEYQYRIAHTSNLPEKFDLEERIRQDEQTIHHKEIEYWKLLEEVASFCAVEEAEAHNAALVC